MMGRPKGVYSTGPFGGKTGSPNVGDEKKEDGSTKKGKNKKKGWQYGKMSVNFDTENVDMQYNGTGAGDLGEDFGVDLVDRNETVGEVPSVNETEQSVPASGLELGWTKEDKKIWIKYGLSPAYLKEMRRKKKGCWGNMYAPRWTFWRGNPWGRVQSLRSRKCIPGSL